MEIITMQFKISKLSS